MNYLIAENKYKITYPCYDDYVEGLSPEVEEIEVIQKQKNGYLVRNLEHFNRF